MHRAGHLGRLAFVLFVCLCFSSCSAVHSSLFLERAQWGSMPSSFVADKSACPAGRHVVFVRLEVLVFGGDLDIACAVFGVAASLVRYVNGRS